MERLPYIDEHAIPIDASPAQTWAALLATMCRDPADPTTVPLGFVLEEASPERRLALNGRHPFAAYRLVFEMDPGQEGIRLRALTFAAFPALRGKVYRALVIGSGGHRIAVHRMLRRVAARAHGNRVCA